MATLNIERIKRECAAIIDSPDLKEIRIVPTKSRKYCLRATDNGILTISCPSHIKCDDDFIINMVKQHRRFIIDRVAKRIPEYRENRTVYLFGEGYEVKRLDDGLYLVNDGGKIFCGEDVTGAVKRLLHNEALPFFKRYTEKIASTYGFTYSDVRLTVKKSCWGYCSKRDNGNVIFYRVYAALVSPSALEYLVVHELCHTRQQNHSPRFWEEVARIVPDYKKRRKELRSFGLCSFEEEFGEENGNRQARRT